MNIAICEDQAPDSGLLCSYIQDYCDKHCYEGKISVFNTGEALLEAFSSGMFHLIFLDIYLPGLSGVKVAEKIRKTDRDCILMFITSSRDFMAEGFDLQASSYVVKPIDRVRMDKAMHMCREKFEKNSRRIQVPMNGKNLAVSIADLIYAEVFGKDAILHMGKGKVTCRIPLGQLEARLGGQPFLRCHRSYIINMNHVTDMRDNEFLMGNGDIVPIRINGRKEVKMAMASFVAGTPSEVI